MTVLRLNRALHLERMTEGPDGSGGLVQSWQILGVLWADVRAGSGRDFSAEEVVLSRVGSRITVRAAEPGSDRRPKAGQRFREGSRTYAIIAVTERDADGRYLTCFCREEEPR